ncbi:MAG: hypothetical protein D8H95_35590 [Lachnospiraceae bacterium]|nr:MAG: hypothetical protein D8H95_35590 [Lachnospiraceae bacterium]
MKRLKASYTVEVSYVVAITLFALSTIIIMAYKEEARVLLNFVAHTAEEQMLYTDKEYEKDSYNKDSIVEEGMGYKNISSRFSEALFNIDEIDERVYLTLKQREYRLDISADKYRPENFMRITTVMESVYESVKD